MIKICVRTCFFGKQNSTLGSVVPLAMFLLNTAESTFCQQRTDLECTVWLVLFILGRPQQLDLDVQLAVGLEVHPDLVERLLRLADQVGEREFAVGDEVVGRHRGVVEHSEPNLDIALCIETGHSFYFQHNTDSTSTDS